jgi:hypothetical protein
MKGIRVTGWGAVSPAGWGVAPLRLACESPAPCPTTTLEHPGHTDPLLVRRVPAPSPRPAFMAHPRLRRSSAISIHAAAATLEALGPRLESVQNGRIRLGIIFTALTGCVGYSERFYREVLKDPATASPIVFPETVFNAPASHLATYLHSNAINYTLIGDPGSFLQAVALAGDWLLDERMDACVVVGAEELNWLVARAQGLFHSDMIVSEGAGALVLERSTDSREGIALECITQPALYTDRTPRQAAARQVRSAFGIGDASTLLFDSLTGVPAVDHAEASAWFDWKGPRMSVKPSLGESFAAGSAWQCVLAADHLSRKGHPSAIVNVVGCNQQAIAARFAWHPQRR